MRPGDELFVNYFGTSEELEVDSKKRMLQEYRDVLVAEKVRQCLEYLPVCGSGSGLDDNSCVTSWCHAVPCHSS